MNIIDTLKNLGFVVPALRVLLGLKPLTTTAYPLRVNAGIQFNQNAGFRVKPGMTSWFIILLFVVLWLPLNASAAKNILVFGDSLSAGYGLEVDKSWVYLLQQELQRTQSGFSVVNASISGETTAGGKQRIVQALKQFRPKIVIVELGANDGLRGTPVRDMESNLDYIINKSQGTGAKVLLLGMKLPPNYGEPYITQFSNVYPRLANKHHILLLPFLLEGVRADQFQADNLHPVAGVQQHIMLNVMQELKHLLH
jgi:acyl-CoA thioesterase-1